MSCRTGKKAKRKKKTKACYQQKIIQLEVFYIPISLLAFAEAGYKTVHFLFPFFGSSEAKTFPVAGVRKFLPQSKNHIHMPLEMNQRCKRGNL